MKRRTSLRVVLARTTRSDHAYPWRAEQLNERYSEEAGEPHQRADGHVGATLLDAGVVRRLHPELRSGLFLGETASPPQFSDAEPEALERGLERLGRTRWHQQSGARVA